MYKKNDKMPPTIEKESILALCAFSAMNLLNYFHRYIPSATKVLIQKDLHLSDLQTGMLFSSFIICYMITSPLIGFLADKRYCQRKYLLSAGILLWSLATSLTSICPNFYLFLMLRLLFGIGEAIYGTLGSPMLSDFFIPAHRNIVMGIFNAAIPIGCALGYAIAGTLAQHLGWRLTFAILGVPGLSAIILCFMREPSIGEKDDEESHHLIATNQPTTFLNRTYLVSVAGFTAVTFGMGGFSDWLPTFFTRYYGLSVEKAGMINGGIIVVGGLFGALIGSLVTELVQRYVTTRHPYFLVASLSMCLCTILSSLALFCFQDSLGLVLTLFSGATFFGWFYNGPINGIIQNCVPASQRARANGLCILCIHLLGDAFSPSIIGLISDVTHKDLRAALIIIPISFSVASIIWFIGWLWVPIDIKTSYTEI